MAKSRTVRQRLLEEIEGLSDDRLEVLRDMAAFLREREEWEATEEVLTSRQLLGAVRKSRAAWGKGKREEFLPLAGLKEGSG